MVSGDHPLAQSSDEHIRGRGPRAPVTLVIIAVNLIVFGVMAFSGIGILVPTVDGLMRWGANYGPLTTGGDWWRLLTCLFVQIGILHLAVNTWVLWRVGRLVERLYGSGFYAFLYLMSGLVASMASLCWHPEILSAGASGAIFGLYGAFLSYLVRRYEPVPKEVFLSILNSTLVFLCCNLIYSVVRSGIDNVAHLGGLCAGLVLGLVLARPSDVDARRRQAVRRLGAGLVASGVLMVVLWPFIPALRGEYQEALTWYVAEEARIMAISDDLVQRYDSGDLRDGQMADRLENECIPHWDAVLETIEEQQMLRRPSAGRRYELFRFLARMRRGGLARLAQGLRSRDRDAMADYQWLQRRADKVVKEFSARMADG